MATWGRPSRSISRRCSWSIARNSPSSGNRSSTTSRWPGATESMAIPPPTSSARSNSLNTHLVTCRASGAWARSTTSPSRTGDVASRATSNAHAAGAAALTVRTRAERPAKWAATIAELAHAHAARGDMEQAIALPHGARGAGWKPAGVGKGSRSTSRSRSATPARTPGRSARSARPCPSCAPSPPGTGWRERSSATMGSSSANGPGRQTRTVALELASTLTLADGDVFTLGEINADWRLDAARLVVLSACETGLTQPGRLIDE